MLFPTRALLWLHFILKYKTDITYKKHYSIYKRGVRMSFENHSRYGHFTSREISKDQSLHHDTTAAASVSSAALTRSEGRTRHKAKCHLCHRLVIIPLAPYRFVKHDFGNLNISACHHNTWRRYHRCLRRREFHELVVGVFQVADLENALPFQDVWGEKPTEIKQLPCHRIIQSGVVLVVYKLSRHLIEL